MSPDARRRLADLARGQHGVVAGFQTDARSIPNSFLHREVERGALRRRPHRVYEIAGAPPSYERELAAAAISCGPSAVVSHHSALALWVPERARPDKHHVTVSPTTGHRRDGVHVHRSATLTTRDRTVLRGVPITGLPRTVLDIAAGLGAPGVATIIDAARRTADLPLGALIDVAERHAGRGRAGVPTLREAINLVHTSVPDSDFESFVLRQLDAAGLERPLHHHLFETDDGVFELDLFWPSVSLNLELDGRHHLFEAYTIADRARDRALDRAGVNVTRLLWSEWVRNPAALVDELRRLGVPNAAR